MPELPPASDVTEATYGFHKLAAPTLSGVALRAFTWLVESPLYGVMHRQIARQSNVPQVLSELQVPEAPMYQPAWPPQAPTAAVDTVPLETSAEGPAAAGAAAALLPQEPPRGLPAAGAAFRHRTCRDYHAAYKSGATTPTQAMQRILSHLGTHATAHPGRPYFISFRPEDVLQQAALSTQRWQQGAPLSVLDGVPFAVKDCVDALPHSTTAGTAFLADGRPVTGDMPAVAALKAAGAILLGKTTMHEIGLGVTGLNTATGTPINPHAPGHYTGGSSSGSAAVVAAGLCPFAIGTDGGGSIRLPAAYCGCVGLKPTNGRIGAQGIVHLDYSVATSGPIAGTVEDCMLLYAVMANTGHPAELQPQAAPAAAATGPPPALLPRPLLPAGELPLAGVVVGAYWPWFEDGDPAVVEMARCAVQLLEAQGAVVKAITVPELELVRVAHTVTIVVEMLAAMQRYYSNPATRCLLNGDVRCSLGAATMFSAAEYIQAQKIRRRGVAHFSRIFKDHDVIVTPTTPVPAPKIPAGALNGGDFNLCRAGEAMRFMPPANLLGMPGISVPIGSTAGGLPVGLQLQGRPWTEATLLRAAAALEAALRTEGAPVGQPAVYLDVLSEGGAAATNKAAAM